MSSPRQRWFRPDWLLRRLPPAAPEPPAAETGAPPARPPAGWRAGGAPGRPPRGGARGGGGRGGWCVNPCLRGGWDGGWWGGGLRGGGGGGVAGADHTKSPAGVRSNGGSRKAACRATTSQTKSYS